MRIARIAALLLVLAALAGCGGGEEPAETREQAPAARLTDDPQRGEEVFAREGCGNCHVVAAAGSTGTIGPNLDEARPTFAEAVLQITEGGGGMPAFEARLSAQEIADVAAFVVESTRQEEG
jgi:mono/diheme cytochrome c family protein